MTGMDVATSVCINAEALIPTRMALKPSHFVFMG
jgi:hypothetical protein